MSFATPEQLTADTSRISSDFAVTVPSSGNASVTLRSIDRLRNELSNHGRNRRINVCISSSSRTFADMPSHCDRNCDSLYCCTANAPPTRSTNTAAAALIQPSFLDEKRCVSCWNALTFGGRNSNAFGAPVTQRAATLNAAVTSTTGGNDLLNSFAA